MINNKMPISPLDCFFSPDKDISKKYIAFNLFDYKYFSEKGYDVIYEKIGLEEVFEEWDLLIKNKEENSVQIKTSKATYELDLKEFFCYRCQGVGYGELIGRVMKKKMGKEVEIKDLFKKAPVKTTIIYKLRRLIHAFSELIANRGNLIENHQSLHQEKNAATLFNNAIFNRINKKKINGLTRTLWEANRKYLENTKIHQYQIKKLIQSLLYLDYKAYKKIQISNFTGASQQAALIYACAHGNEIETVQHGRWMVHHLPSPLYKNFYKDKNLVIWEKEFLENVKGDLSLLSERPKPRIELNNMKKDNYILIGTSAPMFVDLDIYYRFWQTISMLVAHFKLPLKVKLHRSDVLTKNFLSFFQLNTIEIIPEVRTIPTKIIVLNTTFSYEFSGYAEVFNFKHHTTHESLKKFVNSE